MSEKLKLEVVAVVTSLDTFRISVICMNKVNLGKSNLGETRGGVYMVKVLYGKISINQDRFCLNYVRIGRSG